MNDKEIYFNSLKNFTAAEGRHRLITAPLQEFFSEHALHKYRTLAEIEHLIHLSRLPELKLRRLTTEEEQELRKIVTEFSLESSQAVAEYDHFGRKGIGATEHDVKSVELFLRERITGSKYEYLLPWIHFGLTSEDINNLAYNRMLKEGIEKVWLPQAKRLCFWLRELALKYKSTPLLARTHGQPASPTTFGKEMGVFLKRFAAELEELNKIKLNAKVNGAVGNYNTFQVSYPRIDWIKYSQELVKAIGFEPELLTNQRGPKNRIIQLFQTFIRANNILKDLDIDLWLYVSRDLVLQRITESQVGSSTMPHKINPWLIECSESNIEISNALLEVFCRELDVSRLQRDLSDHDFERNYGTALAYSLIAFNYTAEFLGKVSINQELMQEELRQNGQILSEAYQTLLRARGYPKAYDYFKEIFRGKKVPTEKIGEIIDTLSLDEETKHLLKSISVEQYLGKAEELTDMAVSYYDSLFL